MPANKHGVKLTDDDRETIRYLYQTTPRTLADLARLYRVSSSTISTIVGTKATRNPPTKKGEHP